MFHDLPDLDDPAVIGNLVEALLWLSFAVGFAFKSLRSDRRSGRLLISLALSFFVFGLSDVVEAWTGAWWRPWWLLVLKLACVTSFLWGAWQYRRIRRQEWESAKGLPSPDPREQEKRSSRQQKT